MSLIKRLEVALVRDGIRRFLHRATSPGPTQISWVDAVEIGLVGLGFLLYFLVRGAVLDRELQALENALWIIDLQKTLGVYIEPDVNQWAADSALLARLFNFVYFWLDFPLIVAVGLVMFWRQRHSYTLLRDALLLSGGIALVLYWTLPVTPPRLLESHGFIDTLERYDHLSYQAQSMAPFVNPYAALPSLHVGWALILMLVVIGATSQFTLRWGSAAVLVLQSVAVVATANHYILDGVAGALVSLVGLGLALALRRRGYPALMAWLERGTGGAEVVVSPES